MTPSEIAKHLLTSCPSLKNFGPYMFGSALRGFGEDIDLLVVGPSGAPLSDLKSELSAAGEQLPLHILFMLPSEESETDFIDRQGCIALTQLASAL